MSKHVNFRTHVPQAPFAIMAKTRACSICFLAVARSNGFYNVRTCALNYDVETRNHHLPPVRDCMLCLAPVQPQLATVYAMEEGVC